MVPCAIPVGAVRGKSRCTSSGSASVATSKSCGGVSFSPWAMRSRSRTAPPASQACLPAPRSVRRTSVTAGGTNPAAGKRVGFAFRITETRLPNVSAKPRRREIPDTLLAAEVITNSSGLSRRMSPCSPDGDLTD